VGELRPLAFSNLTPRAITQGVSADCRPPSPPPTLRWPALPFVAARATASLGCSAGDLAELPTETMANLKKRYTDAEKERGFAALVLASGNAAAAAKALKEDGLAVPERTLRYWQRKEPQKYARVRDACEAARLAKAGDEWQSLSDKLVGVSHDLADRLREDIKTAKPQERARILRDSVVSGAVAHDKAADARSSNDAVVIAASAEDALAVLKRKGLVIDSTAVEIPSTTEPALPSKE